MTKAEIDNFFTKNHVQIQRVVCRFRSKAVTKNEADPISIVYFECLKRKQASIKLIESMVCNSFKWSNSLHNRENRSIFGESISQISDNSEIDTLIDEAYIDEYQELEYLFARYLMQATPAEKIFFDIYVKQGKRTVREVAKYLQISTYAAHILITNFKQDVMNGKNKLKPQKAVEPQVEVKPAPAKKPAPKAKAK